MEGVEVGAGEVTVRYTIPCINGGSAGETVGVLPFVQDGLPASQFTEGPGNRRGFCHFC